MKIVSLPGDGIGPEVMEQGLRVLRLLLPEAEIEEHPFGLTPLREVGTAMPDSSMAAAAESDAVLLGAVGAMDYSWGDTANPEDALFAIRKALDVFANLRPVKRDEVDLVIVRELVGGLYFGERGVRPDGTVFDTCEYHPDTVERVAHQAFALAAARRGRLTSVDKANVLATSRMWRGVVEKVAPDYPDVSLDHLLVDTAAMVLTTEPARFDVILTENMFGDILSDIAAARGGGLGVLPSASIGSRSPGLFEPAHGSAPDIAGRGVANPSAMILSIALMLQHAFDRPDLAAILELAVLEATAEAPTRDLGGIAGTGEFGDAVVRAVESGLEGAAA